MKKVLKVMLKVIIWLIPCAGTIICFLFTVYSHIGLIGALIGQYGKEYLGEDNTNGVHMKHDEFRALDKKSYDTVFDQARDDANKIEKYGWKILLG